MFALQQSEGLEGGSSYTEIYRYRNQTPILYSVIIALIIVMVCCWNTIFIKQYYLVFFLTLWVSLWLKILILSVPLWVELILVREIIFIYLLFTSYISMELIVNFWIFSNTLFREFSWYQWGESPNYQAELPVRPHKLFHRGMCSYLDPTLSSFNTFICILVDLCLCCVLSCLSIMVGWSLCVCHF
jgi:hypothetical protein